MKPGTPLPWDYDHGNIHGPTPEVVAHPGFRADAAYIVHAANLYPELLTIARELVRWESDPSRYAGDLADLAQTARALLAKCDGAQNEEE